MNGLPKVSPTPERFDSNWTDGSSREQANYIKGSSWTLRMYYYYIIYHRDALHRNYFSSRCFFTERGFSSRNGSSIHFTILLLSIGTTTHRQWTLGRLWDYAILRDFLWKWVEQLNLCAFPKLTLYGVVSPILSRSLPDHAILPPIDQNNRLVSYYKPSGKNHKTADEQVRIIHLHIYTLTFVFLHWQLTD